MENITRTGCLTTDDGKLYFTKNDKAKYTLHFAKVGIDIRTIKTVDEFEAAWDLARPHFNEFLVSIAEDGEHTLEREVLIAIVKGDMELADELTRQLEEQKLENTT